MSSEPQRKADDKDQYPWLSKYPVDVDWYAETPEITMPEMFKKSVAQHGDKPCLHFLGRDYTFNEVDKLSDKFAKSLQDQGYGKGSKIGLCLPNTPFYVIAYFGILKAGATVVNFNPLYAEKEMEHLIKDSGAEMMVTVNVNPILPKVQKMLHVTDLKKVVACDIGDALPPVKGFAYKAKNFFQGLFGKAPTSKIRNGAHHGSFMKMLKTRGKPKPVDISPDDVAVLQYTGGTTGLPKAATLTHGNLTSNLEQANLWFVTDSTHGKQEKMLTVLPFFHVLSMTVQMNMSIMRGWHLVMLPKFDLNETMKTIDAQKPTMFAGVPSLYKAIIDAKNVSKYDLSSLKICLSGGAPMNEIIMENWKKLTGVDIVEGYGLSETSPLATANPINGAKRLNSVGLPVPHTEVRIVDIDKPDIVMKKTETGEICLKGPQVMKGYWNKPEDTKESIDNDGFFHTGDLGHLDEDGYLFITGRKKEMIIVNGLKVFPRKVEEAILQNTKISEVIVAGLPDEQRGEVVKAYIVLKEGAEVSKSEMTDFLKDKLAPYEIPKLVDFRDSLPKTMIGKPDKKVLVNEDKEKIAARAAKKGPKP